MQCLLCDKWALLSWLGSFRADSGISITSVTLFRANAFTWKREKQHSRRNMRHSLNLWLVDAIPVKYLNSEFKNRVVWVLPQLTRLNKRTCLKKYRNLDSLFRTPLNLFWIWKLKNKTNKKTPTPTHPTNTSKPFNLKPDFLRRQEQNFFLWMGHSCLGFFMYFSLSSGIFSVDGIMLYFRRFNSSGSFLSL